MIDKEQLLKIPSLNIAEEMELMDDNQFFEYIQALNTFIESYPVLEEKFRINFEANDYDFIFEGLIATCDLLRKIRADVLAEQGLNLINNLTDTDHAKSEADITNYLADVSTLSIDIQMAMISNEQTEEKDAPPDMEADAPKRKRTSILAVDDVTFFLASLETLLKETGYKLTCVNSGEAALNFLRNDSPDLFLLDIEMPEMNGYELARKIKDMGQTGRIIFLTSNSSHKHVMKAIEAGAVDFIVKPINKAQVIKKIEKVLKKSR